MEPVTPVIYSDYGKQSADIDDLKYKIIEYLGSDGALQSESFDCIDRIINLLIEINRARKHTLGVISQGYAPFKVRRIEVFKIGGFDRRFELGRNFKLFALVRKMQKIAEGSQAYIQTIGINIKTGQKIVMKVYSHPDPQVVKNEFKTCRKVHPIKGFQRGIQLPPYKMVGEMNFLVPQFESDMDLEKLQNIVRVYNLDSVKALAKGGQDLLCGLVAVHKKRLAHRDIKPCNIGIQRNSQGEFEWCLADFGLCTPIGSNSLAGTPEYILFEDAVRQWNISRNKSLKLRLQQKQDVFGLALTLLEIFDSALRIEESSKHIWRIIFYRHTLSAHAEDEPIPDCALLYERWIIRLLTKIAGHFNKEIRDTLYDMLHPNALERITAKQALRRWTKAMASLPK